VESVSLSWTAPELWTPTEVILLGYLIERRVGDGEWETRVDSLPYTQTTFVDTEVVVGTAHQYRVIAKYSNPVYASQPSNMCYATPYYPNTPHDIEHEISGHTVTLSWIAPDVTVDLIGYHVYRGNVQLTDTPITELVHMDTDVPSGKHIYKVSAVYTHAESLPIESYPVYIGFNAPATLTVDDEVNGVGLVWTEPDIQTTINLSGYTIERRLGSGEWDALIYNLPLSPLAYFDDIITMGQTYEYRVIAEYIDPIYFSEPSNVVSATPYMLLPAQDITHSVVGQNVTISWLAPTQVSSGLIGYHVYRGNVQLTDTPITELTHTDTDVPSGKHIYKVSAVYTHAESLPIESYPAYVGFDAPTDLLSTAGVESVSLSWTAPTIQPTITLSGYLIERRYDGGEWAVIADGLPLTPQAFVDSSITAWTVYEYRVRAKYTEPDYIELIGSNVVSATSFDLPPPQELRLVSVGDQMVVFTWDTPTPNPLAPTPSPLSLTGYRIYRNGDILPTPLIVRPFVDTIMLVNGLEYTYTVSAMYRHAGLAQDFESAHSNELVAVPEIDTSIDEYIEPVFVTSLQANYPNPFNPTTTIGFAVASEGEVSIVVYNLKGQRVRGLVSGVYRAGRHSVTWDGTDDAGRAVSSGVYFYRMVAGEYSEIKRMLLLK
jgi:hypothetical protein